MVFYFTGTGNSRWVANRLGKAFDQPVVSIADELKKENKEISYALQAKETIFFVYPVHSWGPAVLVKRFISRLNLEGYQNQPVYSVSACGDECGYTNDKMHKLLYKKGIRLTGCYSVKMPNNYILMKGFDVDSKAVEEEKLAQAPAIVDTIIEDIRRQLKGNLYHIGSMPFIKSKLIYPLFASFAIGRNEFHAMEFCTSCGRCARICPTGTITMKDGFPVWGNTCVQCTACIHHCPVRAIEYGNQTWKKGRYHHPEY